MSSFASFLQAMSSAALDTLQGFDAHAALNAGIDPAKVRTWAQLHDVYLRSSSSPSSSSIMQMHAEAAAKARHGGFSLDQLALIERRLKPLPTSHDRARRRLELLDMLLERGPSSYHSFARAIRECMPIEPKPPRQGVSFSRSRAGVRTMRVTASERDLADLEHALLRGLQPRTSAGSHMLAQFLRLMRGGSDAGGAEGAVGVAHAAPRPLLLIPLPAWTKLLGGSGDDVTLGLTDGTIMSGAEFLNRYYTSSSFHLEAAVFHPQEGAVNLYRTHRHANHKQRDLARATNPVCPVPDCRHGADHCEAHHITAWRDGGETNLNNLAMLCRYHNRTNDDDAHYRRRGRIENIRGTPTWRSPRGFAVPNTHHPFGAMQTLFGR